jgi:hypothetical protein
MIKLFFLMIFLLMGSFPIKADEAPGNTEDFNSDLDNTKNPFDDGMPKPVVKVKPVVIEKPKPVVIVKPKPKRIVAPVITLPEIKVQGVIVGESIHQAIIDDQVVPQGGTIDDVQVLSVTKQGVGLLFKGKKFFLKVD